MQTEQIFPSPENYGAVSNLRGLLADSIVSFPPEWCKAALVLALLSTWVVVALFVYLNRATRRPYFQLWIVAWLFYSVYLVAGIGLQESPMVPFLEMAQRTSLGISAVFMFWGAFALEGRARGMRELAMATALLALWSYAASYLAREPLWITVPMFALLGASGLYTGWLYAARRRFSRGARILGASFLLWGGQLALFPLLGCAPILTALGYVVSAAMTMLIAFGMIIEHQLAQAEQHYRMLFDAAGDALLLVDPTTGCIVEANMVAHSLGVTGTGDELVGRRVSEIFLQWGGLPALNGSRHDVRHTYDTPNGRILDLHMRQIQCPRGAVWLLTAHDETERHRMEEAWRDTARQLHKTLTELRRTRQEAQPTEWRNARSKTIARLLDRACAW